LHTSRREFLCSGGASLSGLATATAGLAQQTAEPQPKLNVLLVLVDDLRPELGCYGSPRVKTPHIDRLAAHGMTFLRSYCQQAASSPSRTTLLTGLRPDTTSAHDQRIHFRAYRPNAMTLPAQANCDEERAILQLRDCFRGRRGNLSVGELRLVSRGCSPTA